ncbi:hypothetical protein LCX93_06190 [Sulfurimonas sp. SWIR-19]|uniref:hypothetical protein n=1 Tax=Sulfurimonas sp. SWIR-19 TaxID=2878390 RepID=UPI001CF496D6|nr:hypothetical protein [Sulfurimonas sp. SWIR-19]UCN01505.1 hypothetical protein LCX93_06190 [Sulfurimonas sp. SWIR-19]
MSMTGMIFQFNSDNGKGLLMLSDGETKEFDTSQWVEKSNRPFVGLKISYDESGGKISVKPYNEATKESSAYSNADECILHFKEEGFKVVKNTAGETTRTITLRKYEMGDFAEVIIKSVNDKISVTHMVNGKKTN